MKYILGLIALVAVSLIGVGLVFFSTSGDALTSDRLAKVGEIEQQIPSAEQLSSIPDNFGHPPPIPLSVMGLASLEEVQNKMVEQQANFTLKIPNLPPGYKVIGARLNELGEAVTDPISKRSFKPQSAVVWIWNQNPTKDTTNREVLDIGGIGVRISHVPGSNSTEPFRNFKNPGYFWGHPGWITYGDQNKKGPEGTTSIGVYHSGRQVLYHLVSSLPAETLLKMMESIVRDP